MRRPPERICYARCRGEALDDSGVKRSFDGRRRIVAPDWIP